MGSSLNDLNYIRADRQQIKGVGYSELVPTYNRISNFAAAIPTNLANIAGKTTDAKGIISNHKIENVNVGVGSHYITISSAGNLRHADSVNRIGVPCFDGADNGNWDSTYVELLNNGLEIFVLGGDYDGYRVVGRSRGGNSISPNSIEIEFGIVAVGTSLSSFISYTWEGYQPSFIDVYYPYRNSLDNISENALRTTLVNGVISGGTFIPNETNLGITESQHASLRQLEHLADGVGGPFEGFLSGAVRDVSGSPIFPTSIIWWKDSGRQYKIVEKIITYTASGFKVPIQIRWNVYYKDGINIAGSVTDNIINSGIFEYSRTRIINNYSVVAGAITSEDHKVIRQLVHLVDGVGGPFEGFVSGTYREMLPAGLFPTSIIWYANSSKYQKIVSKNITYSAGKAISIIWQVYDVDGSTVLHTVTDTINYNGMVETSRTRTII